MLVPVVLLAGLWAPRGAAWAAPFNAYGERTDVGTLGLNPYVGTDVGSEPWASLYVFAGLTPWMDVAVAGSGYLEAGQVGFDSVELIPRFFPLADTELALAGHLTVVSGREVWLGPELHLEGYPTDALGLWVNLGTRYQLGKPIRPETFTRLALEVTQDVPFFAIEMDIEWAVSGEVSSTLIPSFGVWVGKQRQTGFSVGCILPTRGSDVGFGLWIWRPIDLKGEGRRPRERVLPAPPGAPDGEDPWPEVE